MAHDGHRGCRGTAGHDACRFVRTGACSTCRQCKPSRSDASPRRSRHSPAALQCARHGLAIRRKRIPRGAGRPRRLERRARDLGFPGEFPFTRGIQPTMYRGRLWTMRQYAGFGTAAESNARYRYLLVAGRQRPERRLRPADADGLRLRPPAGRRRGRPRRRGHRLARRHGGAVRRHPARRGLDVDDDQRDGDHPAGALRRAWPRRQGVDARDAVGHDPERHPQGVRRARHLHLPAARRRCARHRHLRVLRARAAAAGTRSRSAATTSARPARRRCRRSRSRCANAHRLRGGGASTPGSTSNAFGQRLSFFFNAHNDFLEEIAKFRAARRLWARIMRDRFGATNPRAQQLRFHTQTAGSTLTAQQPDNNIVRVTLQALAAVLGGTQSLHSNGRDEALALPTEEAARLALRTQQIIAARERASPTPSTRSAARGAIEALTDEIEAGARALIERIDGVGGTLAAIEAGFIQREIQEAAYRAQQAIDARRRRSSSASTASRPTTRPPVDVFAIDPDDRSAGRSSACARVRAGRDRDGVARRARRGRAAAPRTAATSCRRSSPPSRPRATRRRDRGRAAAASSASTAKSRSTDAARAAVAMPDACCSPSRASPPSSTCAAAPLVRRSTTSSSTSAAARRSAWSASRAAASR